MLTKCVCSAIGRRIGLKIHTGVGSTPTIHTIYLVEEEWDFATLTRWTEGVRFTHQVPIYLDVVQRQNARFGTERTRFQNSPSRPFIHLKLIK